MKFGLYFDGKFIAEYEAVKLDIPTYTIVSHELKDFPVRIVRTDGEHFALMTAKVYRVCTDNYCYTTIFPSKEAADIFVNQSISLGGQ